MRRILMMFSALIVCYSAIADGGAMQVVQRVARYVKSLGGYEVNFVLTSGEYAAKGYFSVEGDAYYMNVGVAEVYSDGKVRYEVDNERREINVDYVNLSSRNILDNPTRCFDFVGSDYTVRSEQVRGEDITLSLSSENKDNVGVIRLVSDAKTGRPSALEYEMYDEKVKVNILSIGGNKKPIKRFEQSNYRNYEIIDFR